MLTNHPLSGIRNRRLIKDIPAETLAHKIGCTLAAYYRYERGERRIYLDKAIMLASLLDCTLEDLGRDPDAGQMAGYYLAKGARERMHEEEKERAAQ